LLVGLLRCCCSNALWWAAPRSWKATHGFDLYLLQGAQYSLPLALVQWRLHSLKGFSKGAASMDSYGSGYRVERG
jgi:hypothetical protein